MSPLLGTTRIHCYMNQENQKIASIRHFQLPRGSGDVHLVTAIALLMCLVAFAAGCITTEMGQHALKAVAAVRPFPPIDIFDYSAIASLFTVIAASRFSRFQQCFSAFFIMLASSHQLAISSSIIDSRGWSTSLMLSA